MDSTFLNLCGKILKKLQDESTHKEAILEVLDMKFEAKMSEEDYVQYMFFKAMAEMYKAGLHEGKEEEQEEIISEITPKQPSRPLSPRRSKRSLPADNFALKIAPVINEIRANGAATFQEIADELMKRGIATIEGGKWHPATVRSLENRVEKIRSKITGWHAEQKHS